MYVCCLLWRNKRWWMWILLHRQQVTVLSHLLPKVNVLSWSRGPQGPALRQRPALTFQSASRTALWLAPNYAAWWQRIKGVNNIPRVFTQKQCDRHAKLRRLTASSTTDPTSGAMTAYYHSVPCLERCFNLIFSKVWHLFHTTGSTIAERPARR